MVAPPEGGLRTVQRTELLHELIDALTARIRREVPLEARVVIPLALRRQLGAHEQQRFARSRDHVADQRAQVREALPHIAGHLLQQRLLEMHHLVVRQRVHELLAVLVHHREGELVVRTAAEEWIDTEVVQRVVHPSHVPLEREPEPAIGNRMRHTRPRRTLFGDGHDAGVQRVHGVVQLLEERHRLEILAAAESVAHPLAGFTAVVEVQHRGHGVHTNAVDVKLLDPVQRIREQKVAYFMPRVVEDVRSPLRVLAKARILVLVTRSPVEPAQRPIVLRKMRRHPIEQDTDSSLMQGVHERAELVGCTVT